MTTATAAQLPVFAERPLTERPDLPLWSENYLFQAYDAAIDVGFWTHVGLPVDDFELWHDITLVYLPGGVELLISKGYGSRGGAGDVSGSMVRADYDEDTGDWHVRCRGVAQRVDRAALESAPAIDASVEPFACELHYRGVSPIWDLKDAVAGQSWSNAHWEQPCRVSGWVKYGGRRLPFDGAGIRDHSRGSRSFAQMGPYYFLNGEFPSGRAFGLLHVEPTSGVPHRMSTAFVVEAGELIGADVLSVPDDPTFSNPFEVVLSGPHGRESITGTEIHSMTFSLQYPNDVLLGYREGQPQHHVREGQIRWEWAGETGYGVGERGVTLAADGSPERR
jgi:hypothetical protein